MKRLLFFTAFMSLGTFALLKLLVTEPSAPEQDVLEAPQVVNVLNMQDVTVHQLAGERVRWELHAKRAHFNENNKTGYLEDVRFQVYEADDDGSGRQTLFSGRSARAELAGAPGTLVLQGQVLLARGDGLEIRSERVEYDQQRQLVTAPGAVVVHSPQGVQEAASLRYSIADERLEYTRPMFYQ